jgi:RNA polymerase sigma factor (TIGR02999 family)
MADAARMVVPTVAMRSQVLPARTCRQARGGPGYDAEATADHSPAPAHPPIEQPPDISTLLESIRAGDAQAREELVVRLYGELRDCAERQMRHQPATHTLQATALVNEVYLRLCRSTAGPWQDRRHFLRAAAAAMRNVLVDHARGRGRAKRDGRRVELPLDRVACEFEERAFDLEGLDRALKELEQADPDMAAAVEARFFAGATLEEAAVAAGVSKRTFERRWQATRAWLYTRMR